MLLSSKPKKRVLVKAIFWPWLSGKSHLQCCKTICVVSSLLTSGTLSAGGLIEAARVSPFDFRSRN